MSEAVSRQGSLQSKLSRVENTPVSSEESHEIPPSKHPETQTVTQKLERMIDEAAHRIQRQNPRLGWDWCMVLARLEVRDADPAKRSALAQAAADLAAERRYSQRGGWRVIVDREAL